jgi:hypothetical protein
MKAWTVLASSVPDAKIGGDAEPPLEGVAVPTAGSFNACFERFECLWIPKGICLMRNRGRSSRWIRRSLGAAA